MLKNLDKIANELFNKIRSQISNVHLADENAAIVDVPEKARFFSFDYDPHGNSLGSVTITIDDTEGLVIMYSNDILHGQSDDVHRRWFKFLGGLRKFAKQRFLNFEARDIMKSLDKKDYGFLSNNKGDDRMSESKLYGTSKTSYQTVGEARIVVRHHSPVNPNQPQSRSQHIDSIYIENVQGERFKYPVKHLNGARAMARHVANGGNLYDDIGTHITGMSEELSKLKMFKGYVDRNPIISESMNEIHQKVAERITGIKKQFQHLQSQNNYVQFVEAFEQSDSTDIPEEVINDWVDRLTIRSFNEELKKVFPYIYKLVESPIKELTPADFEHSTNDGEIVEAATVDTIQNELMEYERYLDSLVEDADIFNTADESLINQLNELMAEEIPVGADGANAIESLTGLIADQELFDVFKEFADISPEADVRDIIYDFIRIRDEENGTDILSKIQYDGDNGEGGEAPAPSEVPAPSTIADSLNRAIKAGATLEDRVTETTTIKDAILKAGYKVEDFFKNNSNEEDEMVVEFVKSMYDRHTGTFPKGETGVLLSVEKQYGKPATKIAVEAIKHLRSVFETNRMQKLAGIVK